MEETKKDDIKPEKKPTALPEPHSALGALLLIQSELKAPKNQRNTFGNYNYRNCEDILEAVKPLLRKYNCTLLLDDGIELIGTRFYVKATARFIFKNESKDMVVAEAFAREEEIKKGMDGSQITGASSSYARKYALNGLFLIDDTKDADSQDNTKKPEPTGINKRPVFKAHPTRIPAQNFTPAVPVGNTNPAKPWMTEFEFKDMKYRISNGLKEEVREIMATRLIKNVWKNELDILLKGDIQNP